MCGASFIRTDYFVDPMERPEHGGRMRIDPEGLLRYRQSLGADSLLILADIQVKYARMLVERTLSESARLAREAGADAVVVTGAKTGEPPTGEDLEEARRGAGDIPVLIGSGLSPTSLKEQAGIDPKVKLSGGCPVNVCSRETAGSTATSPSASTAPAESPSTSRHTPAGSFRRARASPS
jgi:hypothetical protein